MTTVLAAFHRQACLAVQRGDITVSDACAGAEECLDAHARAIHKWLEPILKDCNIPLCPYRFRRYNSEDVFVFSRDMVEMMHSSEAWVQFLRDLSAVPTPDASPLEEGTPISWHEVTIRFISDLQLQAVVRGDFKPPLNYERDGLRGWQKRPTACCMGDISRARRERWHRDVDCAHLRLAETREANPGNPPASPGAFWDCNRSDRV